MSKETAFWYLPLLGSKKEYILFACSVYISRSVLIKYSGEHLMESYLMSLNISLASTQKGKMF